MTVTEHAVWTWAYGPGANTSTNAPERELTRARGRTVTWRVDGHAFAQFTIDGDSDEAAGIVERRDDLWVYRDGDLLFRGRIVGANDFLNGTEHDATFTATDYRGMLSLAAKVEPPVPTFTNVDQAQIAWDLINDWQSLPGGDWGIVEGLGSTSGQNRDETDLLPFTPVGEAINRLLRRDNGGEWEISPTLELNRWFPARGADNGVVLDYGGKLVQVRRSLPEFGNVAGVTGDPTTTAVTEADANVGTDERGRWTVSQSFPSVKVQATLDDKALWLLDEAFTASQAVNVEYRSQAWGGKDDVWLGDTVELRLASGRLTTGADHRVVEIQATSGDDGVETVRLGLVEV